MPKLKQPASLQNVAMDVLVMFLANYCDQLSIEKSLAKLRRVIDVIKKDISPQIPWHLSMKFHTRFLNEVENLRDLQINPSDIHLKAISEILMDNKIIGLRYEGSIVTYLDPRDADRFQGLKLLDLSFFSTLMHRPISLENFHLQDLTTFVYPDCCTDDDLKVIGQNCPMLKYLDVSSSKKVTDRGLRRLIPCSELRTLFVAYCKVSYGGITELLSVLTEVERLSAWSNSADAGFDCFSHLDLEIVYPSINSFTIVLNRIWNEHISCVVSKFPNLTSLGISGLLVGDLTLLKSMSKLSKLDFSYVTSFSWDKLKKLLPFIGGNITDLRARFCIMQCDLNFLFKICPNLELLEFHYRARSRGEKLAIPPFKKLKELSCIIPREYPSRRAELEFAEMSDLEDLLIDKFYMTARTVTSMILDSTKFPKLKSLKISRISGQHCIDRIRQIVIDNNLDLEILEI